MENLELSSSRKQPTAQRTEFLHYKGQEVVFHARKLNPTTGEMEVWECKWTNPENEKPRKKFIKKVSDETSYEFSHNDYSTAQGICWAPGSTIGNIAVNNKELIGVILSEGEEGNALLPCQMIPCGKFRNGKERWYCKTHQSHWGTIADVQTSKANGNEMICGNSSKMVRYVLEPDVIELTHDMQEIGIWCSLPAAISSKPIKKRPPQIHVHHRVSSDGEKIIDRDYNALVLSYSPKSTLFLDDRITKIQVTPPSAFHFVIALEENREISCVDCKKCGYPHLDLGDFARKPHKKHYCGNCGNDSVISSREIVSSPLKRLHDMFMKNGCYKEPDRTLNLDEHQGKDFEVWASTPAIIWTADRPQERGIHVHVYNGSGCDVNDTFSKVMYQGEELDRKALWQMMLKNTSEV